MARKGTATRAKASPKQREGVIRADEAYTLNELKLRLDLSDSAWWALANGGLPQKQIGKRKMILGKDVLAFLDSQPNVPVGATA